ncbi:hypothetical protein NKJ93_02345 [Mesorhizobium sp. M0028]|uniref:hypothetical protein n=1 Tax=Mesorhizobium sp. M0028 TaxID=2956849 RepID=UPI003336C3EA
MSRKVQIVNLEKPESERDVIVTTHDGRTHTIRPGRTLNIETGDVIGVSHRSLVDRIELPPVSPELENLSATLDDAKKDVADITGLNDLPPVFEEVHPVEDGEFQEPVEPGPENQVEEPVTPTAPADPLGGDIDTEWKEAVTGLPDDDKPVDVDISIADTDPKAKAKK